MKKCKGTLKAKGLGCGKDVEKRTYGLCDECKKDWMLNTESGQEYFSKFLIRHKKNYEKEQRAKNRKAKETIIDYKKKLQDKINKIARQIDNGLPCLAKGIYPKQMHGGHVYSRGSHQSMRFNLHNIHRQSAQSNHFQNEDGLFREGLVKEYGQDYFDFLTSLREIPSLKYNNQEYHEFYKIACEVSNMLKKKNLVYGKEDRIKLRNDINNVLGIYDQKYCEYAKT